MTTQIVVDNYTMYDSETNEPIHHDDLGITLDEMDALIIRSVECGQAEGHIVHDGRRMYAADW